MNRLTMIFFFSICLFLDSFKLATPKIYFLSFLFVLIFSFLPNRLVVLITSGKDFTKSNLKRCQNTIQKLINRTFLITIGVYY